ncbi:hypothetical protein PtB15_16B394 [Puccinia triticina]|nr:hypothetical protein PtB15_16B394 [Puccinia triticina]
MTHTDQSSVDEETDEDLYAAYLWLTESKKKGTVWDFANMDEGTLMARYRHARELEGKVAFDRDTIILGHMPYSDEYQVHLKPGQDTVSLDQALNLLATTAGQPGESSGPGTSHHAGTGRELGKTSSKLMKLKGKQTKDYSREAQPTNHRKNTESHDGSSNPIPSEHEISHVLLGQQERCFCLKKFKLHIPDEENRWTFSKVAQFKKCRHYFHVNCLQRWMVKHWGNSCPYCRGA